jgi:hypothetical protein
MIEVEGYKAFIGTMRIVPKNPQFPVLELHGNWLYKPEFHCWYGNGHSYSADICEVVVDFTDEFDSKHECLQCGKPTKYKDSLCHECIGKATKEKEDYINYVKSVQGKMPKNA